MSNEKAGRFAAAAPSWLRPFRMVSGVLLLTLAWMGLVGIVLLARMATEAPLSFLTPSLTLLLPVLELLAALWIGLAAAMAIVVGSF